MNTRTVLLCAMLTLLSATSCQKRSSAPVAKRDTDNIFVWNRPAFTVENRPIAKSATCRFKQSLDSTYYKRITDEEPNPPPRIYYGNTPEDEADTVAFVDLDTDHPSVQSNGGQAPLAVLGSSADQIHVANKKGLAGLNAVEIYTIFRDSGVIIHTKQWRNPLLGPFATLEMGYCN